MQNVAEYQLKMDKLRLNLIQTTSQENPLRFIVELYERENLKIFRIIDTIFI